MSKTVSGTLQWQLAYEDALRPTLMKVGATTKAFVYATGVNAPDVIIE